ncbi:MAG: hypothetical protein M1836_002736 [Candelina mexicana]|nr:MAG: hypothetical protein M1836_002736 [Candelina mexicana]
MATKVAKPSLGGMHTAGIYSDMTVDGPEIGTLVLIVDKAKNLPNRKTMGKQDPYCAARLGKEAKRTETDKRGGQTPRWDQELRFTVHDSADYYQLKVSVFNDDKKTDLIGETWVDLEAVVVPGGGQNDLWHTLNCRGRYAGEVRIELTYYDTRPKEESVTEKRRDSARVGTEDGGREAIGGPRQPKTVKRRPLPADPTNTPPARPVLPDHTQSSPLPQSPQRGHKTSPLHPNHSPHQSIDHTAPNNAASHAYHTHTPSNLSHPHSSSESYHDHPPESSAMTQARQPPLSAHHNDNYLGAGSGSYGSESYGRHRGDIEVNCAGSPIRQGQEPPYPQHAPREDYYKAIPPHLPSHSRHGSSGAVPPGLISSQRHTQMSSEIPTARRQSTPEYTGESQGHSYNSNVYDFYGPSTPQRNHYAESPLRHQSHEDGRRSSRGPMQPTVEDEDVPPPPPAHRSSGNQMTLFDGQAQNGYVPSASPAPLNIPTNKGNASPSHHYGSPEKHSQIHSTGGSASTRFANSPSGVSGSSRTSFSHQSHGQVGDSMKMSPVREMNHPMPPSLPPSLVPGYDPTIAEELSERLSEERALANGHGGQREQPPSYQGPPSYESQIQAQAQPVLQQVMPPVRSEVATYSDQGETHGSSAPMIKPRAVSPDPRIPARKSVSPQPGPPAEERRLSAVPFGPDSYDAFNPNAGSSSTINQPGAQYQTPDQAKEVSWQRQRESHRPEGPIVSADGRVIDPSDHLPTDTWAPEPERKTPKHTPEPAARSRPSPLGAQPMPQSGRKGLRDGSARPHSIATPIYAHSAEPSTPASSARVRLQKKIRMSPGQPASSPLVPTLNNTPRSLPRAAASEYPLREHENYGYGNSPNQAGSPVGPPPLPAKVPIQAGQEDYSALSEEMKRIDIGVGNGSGKARRSRYGL